jgi:hypothetical protein
VNLLRALLRLTRVSDEHLPVNNVTQPFHFAKKKFSVKTEFGHHHSAFDVHGHSRQISFKKNFHGFRTGTLDHRD